MNLASRLCRWRPTSDPDRSGTADAVGDKHRLVALGAQSFKGYERPVNVFLVEDERGPSPMRAAESVPLDIRPPFARLAAERSRPHGASEGLRFIATTPEKLG